MCFNRERRKKWKDSEKEKRRGTNKKPLVFGRGHLLHSRDCENGRRECVCVCMRVNHCVCLSCLVYVCGANVCVNSCVLLSRTEKEGGRCF